MTERAHTLAPDYFKPETINRVLGVPLKYGAAGTEGLPREVFPSALHFRHVQSQRLLP